MKYSPVLILLGACCLPRTEPTPPMSIAVEHDWKSNGELMRQMAAVTYGDALTHLPEAGETRAERAVSQPIGLASSSTLGEGLSSLRGCMDAHMEALANQTTSAYKAPSLHRGDGIDWRQGELEVTERQFDLAIDGEGLFRVTLPDGRLAYTRRGDFSVDAEGNLVLDENLTDPQFTIPTNTLGITVDSTGQIFVVTADSPETPQQLGQFTLTRFVNPSGLTALRDGLYVESDRSGNPYDDVAGDRAQGFGKIRQGFLERSNVDAVAEYVNLLEDARAIKTILKAIEATR